MSPSSTHPRAALVVTCKANDPIRLHQHVAINPEGRVVSLESASPAPSHLPLTVLTPGLINTHTHLELTPVGAQQDDLPEDIHQTTGHDMARWLVDVIQRGARWPQTPQAKYERTREGLCQMRASGVTCVNDIGWHHASLEALGDSGMRGRMSLEFFAPPEPPPATEAEQNARWEKYVQPIVERFHAAEEWLNTQEASVQHRVELGLSPHTPYSVGTWVWQQVQQACNHPPIHTHVAECQAEVDWCHGIPEAMATLHQHIWKQTYTAQPACASPLEFLIESGIPFPPKTVMAHGVYLTHKDRTWLAQNKDRVGLAHCPRSNLYLQGKTFTMSDGQQPSTELNPDFHLGLGTDSLWSSPSLDLREEARKARALHGLSAKAAFELMTCRGAAAMGWGNQVGQLTPGYWADLVCWHIPTHLQETVPQLAELHQAVQSNLPHLPSTLEPVVYELLLHPEVHPQCVWTAGKPLS